MKKIDTYNQILDVLDRNRKELKKLYVSKIGLFGSFAKNKQHKKSDVDIIVKLDKKTFDNYATLLILLEKLLKRKIDLVFEESLRPEFNYVKKEAKYVRL